MAKSVISKADLQVIYFGCSNLSDNILGAGWIRVWMHRGRNSRRVVVRGITFHYFSI